MDKLGSSRGPSKSKAPTRTKAASKPKAPVQGKGKSGAPKAKAPQDGVKLSGEKPAAGKSPIDFKQNFGGQKPLQLQDGKSMRKGSSNHDQVRQMQEMLNSKGAKLETDGKFGPKTEAAVRKFQDKANIGVDGIVGAETLSKLNTQGTAAPGKAEAASKPENGAAKPGKVDAPARPEQGPAKPGKVDALSPAPAAQPGSFNGALDQAAQGRKADLGQLKTLQDARQDGKNLYFKAGGQIDVDGSGPGHGDPHKQYQTSLSLKGDPKYPNADKVPYFVLPPSVAKQYGAKVGDLGLIRANGKVTPAVFADVGPKNKIGELSRFAAQKLGIPDSPVSGGTT